VVPIRLHQNLDFVGEGLTQDIFAESDRVALIGAKGDVCFLPTIHPPEEAPTGTPKYQLIIFR
jgi:hypothetical protein